MRPLIGIEVDLEANPAGRRYTKCYEAYSDQVVDAGGAPILLPPAPEEVTRELLGRVQGLVIPGGDDFSAEEWGEEQRACERFVPVDRRRLTHGKALMRLLLELGHPLLGVCYGAQLLNLTLGGTLVQDIPHEVEQPLDHTREPHLLQVAAGTLLARIAGSNGVQVNSRHHQAVREPGRGLVASARAPDGVVEAIEGEDPDRFLLGVQWHPEELESPAGAGLFKGLVEAARQFAQHRPAPVRSSL